MTDRASEASEPVLITDKVRLAEKEAENALAQFDWAMAQVDDWLKKGESPHFRISTILHLHRLALEDIHAYAGNFRPAGVAIKGSKHIPVSQSDVPRYVEEMLQYLEANWDDRTAIHLSSYVLWRLNWIHPFSDGNGRTARILSYMVMCAQLRMRLPGTNTIPEQISVNKKPYYEALDEADAAYKLGNVDVSRMEKLLESYLANQLLDIHEKATGNTEKVTNKATYSEDALVEKRGRSGIIGWIEMHPALTGLAGAILIAVVTILLT